MAALPTTPPCCHFCRYAFELLIFFRVILFQAFLILFIFYLIYQNKYGNSQYSSVILLFQAILSAFFIDFSQCHQCTRLFSGKYFYFYLAYRDL